MATATLDHFVLTVDDLERTQTFYRKVPGVEPFSYNDDRWALRVGDSKINLHGPDGEFYPDAAEPTVGAGDFCVVVDASEAEIVETFESEGIDIIEGPVDRDGANGPIRSVYVRDPDGNLVEIATRAGE